MTEFVPPTATDYIEAVAFVVTEEGNRLANREIERGPSERVNQCP